MISRASASRLPTHWMPAHRPSKVWTADALLAAKRPLIISGSSLGSTAMIEAAANIAKALKLRDKQGSISLIVPEANSMGLAMFGGESVDAALDAVISGKADAIVVLENDLYRRVDAKIVDAALSAAKVVIVADHQKTPTVDRAHLVLPAASFAEGDGTLVSQEGRAQRFFQVFDPTYLDPGILVHEGWRWMTEACASSSAQLAGIVNAAPSASLRIKGLKLAREPLRGRRCAPTSACTSRVFRKTKTPPSRFPWKAIRVLQNRASRCHSPGLQAGTRHKPGTSSRTKSVVICVLAIPARA